MNIEVLRIGQRIVRDDRVTHIDKEFFSFNKVLIDLEFPYARGVA